MYQPQSGKQDVCCGDKRTELEQVDNFCTLVAVFVLKFYSVGDRSISNLGLTSYYVKVTCAIAKGIVSVYSSHSDTRYSNEYSSLTSNFVVII